MRKRGSGFDTLPPAFATVSTRHRTMATSSTNEVILLSRSSVVQPEFTCDMIWVHIAVCVWHGSCHDARVESQRLGHQESCRLAGSYVCLRLHRR